MLNTKNTYKKKFESTQEEQLRYANFEEVLNHHNEFRKYKEQEGLTFDIGLTEFSDWDHSRRLQLRNQIRFEPWIAEPVRDARQYEPRAMLRTLPQNLDYRETGAVLKKTKFQAKCGACWAFAAVEAMQSHHFLKTGTMYDLSVQNALDCSRSYGAAGCSGGYPVSVFKYSKVQQGFNLDKCYKYKFQEGAKCGYSEKCNVIKCVSYTQLPKKSENGVMEALSTAGPAACLINASPSSFINYKSGIYNDPKCSNSTITHAVLLIGYGTENGVKYWLLKNSWGNSWGEKGYMRLARKDNLCNILVQCVYPNVVTSTWWSWWVWGPVGGSIKQLGSRLT